VFTLAHISDWHATPVEGVRLRELMNKRLLGWLSWWSERRYVHRPEVLRALFEDLKGQRPDHVAVTGDLTHISLEQEFIAAEQLLGELGPPSWVSLVPGNHDAYVRVPPARGWDRWSHYMASDEAVESARRTDSALAAPLAAEFPTLRIRGPIALIGLCTAQPTAPGLASGRVGSEQLERLAASLSALGSRGICRVVLSHHPISDDGLSRRRRLADSADVRSVLREVGAELVLHGHGHRTQLVEIPGPSHTIPVVGVRSSSHAGESEERLAQYHLFRIESVSSESRCPRVRVSLSIRGYDAASGGFVAVEERAI
jgi:3',5'-cyclic AMP phosphodiesterase CpdA